MSAMKIIKKKIVAIKKSGAEVEKEIREKTLGYIVTSFGLVAGLAWNEAIKAGIEQFFPMPKDTLKAKLTYALVITMIVVLISVYLVRLFKSEDEEVEEIDEKAQKKKKTSSKKKDDIKQ